MPVSYGHPMEEYDRLMNGVALWDVSVERQVEIIGPDAATLIQLLSVRDLSNIEVNPIGSGVSEILRYKHTNTQTHRQTSFYFV